MVELVARVKIMRLMRSDDSAIGLFVSGVICDSEEEAHEYLEPPTNSPH